MVKPSDHILIVENDPSISDLTGRQTLQAAGYQVTLTRNAAECVARAVQIHPDVIIANISLPGLNCKDLLVALKSQEINAPVIVLAKESQERALIQTFRLGAADFLLWPAREAEIIASVERLLKQSRERRSRENLAEELQHTNDELQKHVRELTTIYGIGKALTNLADQAALFEKILDGAASVTQAEIGWLLVWNEGSKTFMLASHHNLPPALASQHNQPLDEGISSLVATSGESLSISGEPLQKFKLSSVGRSALISPVKAQQQVIGLLVMMRRHAKAFNNDEQNLLEMFTDFASISLVNARLFRSMEDRTRTLQGHLESALAARRIDREVMQVAARELFSPIERSKAAIKSLEKAPSEWNGTQHQILETLHNDINQIAGITYALGTAAQPVKPGGNLKELVSESINRLQPAAKQCQVTITADFSSGTNVPVGNPEAVSRILDALISNGIRFSGRNGAVTVRVEKPHEQEYHLIVADSGMGMDADTAAQVFDPINQPAKQPRPFGGIGIRLPLVQQIVTSLHGKIWVESSPKNGTCFHVTLPIQKQLRS
jgi:signal transduction histidine kinase/DNA-binding response OmpR family regulator